MSGDGSSIPLISIGVPVYNGKRYLREALDSALAQDYPHFEVIVSDNASTDGTEAVAREYAEKDARIRYWRNAENLGALPNFGQAFALSNGKYFTWLACDDVLSSPRYLSTTAAFLDANPDVMLCGGDFHLLDLEGPGQLTTWTFPQIYPNRESRDVRSIYFGWPQDPACFAIYGMFRREALEAAFLAAEPIEESRWYITWSISSWCRC